MKFAIYNGAQALRGLWTPDLNVPCIETCLVLSFTLISFKVILLTFEYFDVGDSYSQGYSCHGEYLEVVDRSGSSKYCGNHLPSDIVSAGSWVELYLRNPVYDNYKKGFKIVYFFQRCETPHTPVEWFCYDVPLLSKCALSSWMNTSGQCWSLGEIWRVSRPSCIMYSVPHRQHEGCVPKFIPTNHLAKRQRWIVTIGWYLIFFSYCINSSSGQPYNDFGCDSGDRWFSGTDHSDHHCCCRIQKEKVIWGQWWIAHMAHKEWHK